MINILNLKGLCETVPFDFVIFKQTFLFNKTLNVYSKVEEELLTVVYVNSTYIETKFTVFTN